MQPVLVIGGTRGTGLLIARLLHQRGTAVRVLARDRERARRLFDSSIAVMTGDLTEPETLPSAIEGSRHIVFTAGCRSGVPVREQTINPTIHLSGESIGLTICTLPERSQRHSS